MTKNGRRPSLTTKVLRGLFALTTTSGISMLREINGQVDYERGTRTKTDLANFRDAQAAVEWIRAAAKRKGIMYARNGRIVAVTVPTDEEE
jgi:hypothetical protein